jgi:hypothetical protein
MVNHSMGCSGLLFGGANPKIHADPQLAHTVDMKTLEGFPYLPAMVRAEQSPAAPHATSSGRRTQADRPEQ